MATDDTAYSPAFEIGFEFITAVNMNLAASWKVKKHCFWWWFLGKVGISTRLHRVTFRNMKTLPFVQFWGLKRVYIHQGRVGLKYVRFEVLTAGFLRTEVFWDLKLCRHNLEDFNSQTQLVCGIAALKYSPHSLSKVSHECCLSYPFQEAQNRTTNFFFCDAATQRGSWPPHSWGFWITHNDAPQSVGLLWTSDQLVAETSTWQHTTLTTDKHLCPGWDSNPRSQQASGRRPKP